MRSRIVDDAGLPRPSLRLKGELCGSAVLTIVNATGPIRQIVQNAAAAERRYLVIAPGEPSKYGDAVQVQNP